MASIRYIIGDVDRLRDLRDLWRLAAWPVLFTICQVAVLVQLLLAALRARRHARLEG